MLRYKTETRPGLVSLYDIRPGNGAELLRPRSPHGATQSRTYKAYRCELYNFKRVLSLHLNGHFPGGPGLANTRMSQFWILSEQRMTEVVVTTGAIRCATLQSNRHHQQTNTEVFTGQKASCHPHNSIRSLKGIVCLFVLLVFNGTFSTYRLYRAIGIWNIYCVGPGGNT